MLIKNIAMNSINRSQTKENPTPAIGGRVEQKKED